jgi:hypothetical protein
MYDRRGTRVKSFNDQNLLDLTQLKAQSFS